MSSTFDYRSRQSPIRGSTAVYSTCADDLTARNKKAQLISEVIQNTFKAGLTKNGSAANLTKTPQKSKGRSLITSPPKEAA